MRSLCVLLITLFFPAVVAAHDLDSEVAYLPPTAQPIQAQAQVQAQAPVPARVSVPGAVALKIEEPIDPTEVAYDLTMSWLKPDEWKAKVKSIKSKFDDWESSNDGDIARYLNDRLICVAMSCAGGKVESLKNGFAYLALYKEFNQQAPSLIAKIFREHRESLLKLFAEFTWERASDYVKNKEWRKDPPETRKKNSDRERENAR